LMLLQWLFSNFEILAMVVRCVGRRVSQPAIILRKRWAKVSRVRVFHVQKYSRTWEQLWSTTVTPRKCGPRDSTWGRYKWTFWCIHSRHIGTKAS
jgi:hypothetical protein